MRQIRPNAEGVGWEGWLFLAVVIDAFGRKIAGYAMADRFTPDLVIGIVINGQQRQIRPEAHEKSAYRFEETHAARRLTKQPELDTPRQHALVETLSAQRV